MHMQIGSLAIGLLLGMCMLGACAADQSVTNQLQSTSSDQEKASVLLTCAQQESMRAGASQSVDYMGMAEVVSNAYKTAAIQATGLKNVQELLKRMQESLDKERAEYGRQYLEWKKQPGNPMPRPPTLVELTRAECHKVLADVAGVAEDSATSVRRPVMAFKPGTKRTDIEKTLGVPKAEFKIYLRDVVLVYEDPQPNGSDRRPRIASTGSINQPAMPGCVLHLQDDALAGYICY